MIQNNKSYILAGTMPSADDQRLRLFYLFDAENSLQELIADINHDLTEVPPGSEARDVSTNRSWVCGSTGDWIESAWYGPGLATKDDVAQVSYVKQADAQVLKEANAYSDAIAGAATASIKVVDVKPTTPIAKTMYYVGTANPYDIYYYDEDLVEHAMGTSNPSLVDYQTKTDNALATTDKTVVGAINELKALAAIPAKINGVKLENDKTSSDLKLIGDDNLKEKIIDLIYPVGSVYMSFNNASPEVFLGGVWQQISNKFLLAASATHAVSSEGGHESITYTPKGSVGKHSHDYEFKLAANGRNDSTSVKLVKYNNDNTTTDAAATYGETWSNVNQAEIDGKIISQALEMKSNTSFVGATFTGDSEVIDTMPPYVSVFMWKRIS